MGGSPDGPAARADTRSIRRVRLYGAGSQTQGDAVQGAGSRPPVVRGLKDGRVVSVPPIASRLLRRASVPADRVVRPPAETRPHRLRRCPASRSSPSLRDPTPPSFTAWHPYAGHHAHRSRRHLPRRLQPPHAENRQKADLRCLQILWTTRLPRACRAGRRRRLQIPPRRHRQRVPAFIWRPPPRWWMPTRHAWEG